MKKFILGLALVLVSFSTFAVDVTAELGVNDNNDAALIVSIPVSDGVIDYDAVLGLNSTMTRVSEVKKINGQNVTVDLNNAEASYLVIGIQGHKYIINDFVEAVVRADYAARNGGSTIYSDYGRANGKQYDPNGGLNISVGANMILKKGFILGAIVETNVNSGESTLKLKLGGRF